MSSLPISTEDISLSIKASNETPSTILALILKRFYVNTLPGSSVVYKKTANYNLKEFKLWKLNYVKIPGEKLGNCCIYT